ncbi:MAG: peroxiredoxin family protein [Chitinophagales bacterium]
MNRVYVFLFLIIMHSNAFSQMTTGNTATEISLPDGDGNLTSLSALKGKVVLIDFWASWCGPCRRNNPHLVKLYQKYHGKGLEIYGVSLDNDHLSWKEAVVHDKLSWIQVIDDKGWDAPSASAYGVEMIPSSFLVDKEGVIRKINVEGPKLEKEIKALLK